jgi:autotransporter-associated beta strand protein
MNVPNHPQTRYAKHFATLAALSLGILAQKASAADVTWGGNTSNLWNTGANWSTSAIPTNGDTLVFGSPGTSGLALTDDIAALTVGGVGTDGIVIGSSASSYTLARSASQTITLGSSAGGIGVKNTSLFLQTISAPLTFSTNQTVQVGDTTGAALSSLTTGTGVWTGGGRLTKTGTGLLTLGSSNVVSGYTINQGTINAGSDNQLSTAAPASATTGWLVLNGGTLRTNVNAGWTLNANRGIALGDGTLGSGGTINVTSTSAATANTLALTYNGIIADNGGTNSLTKTGIQILALGGANTYTGATKINQGQITLDFTAGTAPSANIINSSSNLIMGGYATSLLNTAAGAPILLVQGSNSAGSSQNFNGATFNQGNSNVVARGGSDIYTTTLALGAITHTSGGTVGFSLINNGGTAAITTTTANTNGILGGFATTGATAVGTGTTPVTQTDWAANDGSGNIVAYTGYTLTSGASPTLASSAANNVRISSASTGNISLTFASGLSELNTIQSTDTAARTIAVGSGNTLRLGSLGGVWTASTGTLTIGALTSTGGILTAGGADNTAGEIVFNAGATTTINSVIADNGSGSVSIVKTGTAALTLNGSNSFSGGTFVNQGTLNATNANSLGGAGRDVTVSSGALVSLAAGGGLTYANNFKLAGSSLTLGGTFSSGAITVVGNTVSGTVTLMGDTTIGNSGTNGTISGKITGDYNLSVVGALTLSYSGNDYTGNFGINGTTGPLGGNPVTVKLGDNEVLANGTGKGNVFIAGGTTGPSILDLNGKTETINGLISSGTLAQVRITNTSATASTLTLGDNDQTTTYAGTIFDGTGTVRIVKIGKGIQTFSGLNTYTGGTAVDAGTLAIGNSFTMSGANRISIAATGLAGTNYATVKSTSGTLTFGGTLGINITASLSGGESFNLFTSNGGALAGDFGTTAGNVSLTGSYIASLTNNGSGIWTGTASGLDFTFSTSGVNAGILSVAVSSVPEPSTYAALFGTLVLGVAVMQRRRSKKSV